MTTKTTTILNAANTVDRWEVRPADQGQIVEYAYGTSEDGDEMIRCIDRSDRRTSYAFVTAAGKHGTWADAAE